MPNILVTGGAGYIGSHTCKALAAAGYTPVAYDNLAHGHEWAVKWGPLEKGDILDAARLAQVIETYKPTAAVHFAAYAYVAESVSDPAKYYRNNVAGTLTLLEALRAQGVARLIFSSSCATYGIPDSVPIMEDAPQRPISPYGMSKLMAEHMLGDFRAAYGLKSIALRYFNAAGADPGGEIGEDHDPETHLIPLVLDAAAGKRPNITILGNDYDTPDGTCIRDYVHVADLADAHVRALQGLERGELRAAYNLGTGTGVSVSEVIQTAMDVTARPIPTVMGQRRAGDPPRLFADPARIRAELGWVPRQSAIRTIIETAWNWRQRQACAG